MVMPFKVPPAWSLVLVGLVLNILAIVMSSVVLDRLSAQIATLAEQKDENIYSIQLAWSSVETLERKREAILLHLNQVGDDKIDDALQTALQGQLSAWLGGSVPLISRENLSPLMMQINQAQQGYRNQIDDYYLKNISITEKAVTLNERVTSYKLWALILQVLGLSLILSRDLRIKV
jgi:hypothetical protein